MSSLNKRSCSTINDIGYKSSYFILNQKSVRLLNLGFPRFPMSHIRQSLLNQSSEASEDTSPAPQIYQSPLDDIRQSLLNELKEV